MKSFEESIEGKINEIVAYIIDKPAAKVTLDDYTILRDVLSRNVAADSQERMAKLMAMVVPNFPSSGQIEKPLN